jgi:hypothetical protein
LFHLYIDATSGKSAACLEKEGTGSGGALWGCQGRGNHIVLVFTYVNSAS